MWERFLDCSLRSLDWCANRHIASRRLLYRERGGGGESETPIDLQSVEGATGPPSHRRGAVPLRTRVPRGVVLARDAGDGRDDSRGTRVVLRIRDQGARGQPRVRAVRRSRGRRREPLRLRREAIPSVRVHRLGPKPVFHERLLRVVRDRSPEFRDVLPRLRPRGRIRKLRSRCPRLVPRRGNRARVHRRRDPFDWGGNRQRRRRFVAARSTDEASGRRGAVTSGPPRAWPAPNKHYICPAENYLRPLSMLDWVRVGGMRGASPLSGGSLAIDRPQVSALNGKTTSCGW